VGWGDFVFARHAVAHAVAKSKHLSPEKIRDIVTGVTTASPAKKPGRTAKDGRGLFT
jgi:hypothetical protein